MNQRRKSFLIIGFVFLMTLVTLATIVSALQQDLTTDIAHKIDLNRPSLLSDKKGSSIGRGNIYDRNLNQLAVNNPTTAVYVRPLKLRNPGAAAKSLASVLDRNADEIASRLKSETGLILLAREVAPQTVAKIAALNLEGISLVEENSRLYPNGKTGAHVVGFANNEQGLDGIEYFYDTILQTNSGPSSAMSLSLPGPGIPMEEIGDQGVHLILTIDLRVQKILERCLNAVVKGSVAASGSAAIIALQNGALIALANQPTFDPNRFWNFSNNELCNRFLNDAIAPGGLESFFKQAAEFEDIKALTRTVARSIPAEKPKPNGLLIVPTRKKKAVADQNTVVDNEILADLFRRLRSRAAVVIDLPNLIADDTGGDVAAAAKSATGLQLLSDFCFIIGGGRRIAPHLVHTVWDRASNHMLSASAADRSAAGQSEVPEQTVLQVLQHLGKKGPAGGLFMESVIMRSGNGSLQETLATTSAERTGTERVNYQMLGLLSQEGQTLALILTINDADLAMLMNTVGKDSLPITVLGRHLDRRAIQWALAHPAEPTPAMLHLAQRLLPAKMKRSSGGLAAASGAVDGPGDEMPRVIGRSLRFGLQTLQQYDLRISVKGSGLIVAQKPKAGTTVRKGDPCILKLATTR